jgi:hypothetical protein
MFTNVEINNTTDPDLLPIQILLAESDLVEIARIRSNINREFQDGIQIVNNYDNLLARIATKKTQILILGRIDRTNYFEICQECHKIQENLPIVLISRQKIIDDCFRQLARAWGAIDSITNDSIELNRLFQKLDRSIIQDLTNEPEPEPEPELILTGQTVLIGLGEIATIGNNYFGPLAQGNYWRKAHDRIVDKFSFISNWSADHFGKLSCNESILGVELTTEEIQSLRIWVHFFIEECERIIIGFGEILHNSDISATAKALLSKS